MGEVAVILKVMPESPAVDMEALQAEIKERIPGIQDMRIEPIGFGLSAIKIAMITGDEEGSSDKIEGLFANIAGIDRAEIESLNRML
jgi:elongation factor 1-beta